MAATALLLIAISAIASVAACLERRWSRAATWATLFVLFAGTIAYVEGRRNLILNQVNDAARDRVNQDHPSTARTSIITTSMPTHGWPFVGVNRENIYTKATSSSTNEANDALLFPTNDEPW